MSTRGEPAKAPRPGGRGRRPFLWVILAFLLPLAGLPTALRAPGADRWEPVRASGAPGAVRQVVAGAGPGQAALYAVVQHWGVYQSADGGLTWLLVNRLPRGPLGRLDVGALALSPDDPQVLLAGIQGRAAAGWPGVYKTSDRGRSWLARRGLGALEVEALAIAPGNVVYAAGGKHLFYSADGGDTWLEMRGRPSAGRILALAVEPRRGALYVGTEGEGLWLSVDRGASWTAALPGHTISAIATLEGGQIYAGARDGLYRSADGGASWQRLPLPSVQGPVVAMAAGPGAWGPLYVAVAGQPVVRSGDGGAHWQSLPPMPLAAPVTALALGPQPAGQLFVGTGQGLWRLVASHRGLDGLAQARAAHGIRQDPCGGPLVQARKRG